MSKNKLMCGVVSLVVLITIVFSFGDTAIFSQQNNKNQEKKQDYRGDEDILKYPEVKFNEPEPQDVNERERKRRKSSRFDRKEVVRNRVHPETSGISIDDGDEEIGEQNQLLPLPVIESELIFIGKVKSAKASLSNDKTGIYSEYQVSVIEVIKNDPSGNLKPQMMIDLDRAGGTLIYPNGGKVIYFSKRKSLPKIGSDYVFFVKRNDDSPNFEVLTGYEFFNNLVYPLDYNYKVGFQKYKGYDVMNFIDLIRRTIQSLQTNNQGEKASDISNYNATTGSFTLRLTDYTSNRVNNQDRVINSDEQWDSLYALSPC